MAHLTVIIPPMLSLVSLDDAKTYLRVEDSFNDADITRLIDIVRAEVERVGGVALGTQTLEYTESLRVPQHHRMIAYPRQPYVALPRAPLQMVESVQALDPYGAWQDVDLTGVVTYDDRPPRLFLIRPFAYAIGLHTLAIRALRIRYTAGYIDAASVPSEYIQAMYELLAFRYENREGGSPPSGILANIQRGHMRL
jgi:uncharacterized phiE125 gp8 family phage protein